MEETTGCCALFHILVFFNFSHEPKDLKLIVEVSKKRNSLIKDYGRAGYIVRLESFLFPKLAGPTIVCVFFPLGNHFCPKDQEPELKKGVFPASGR